jgi:hypothetical protein
MIHDYIVVGSGPTGAQAAQTLVEGNGKVAMLDVGITDDKYKSLVPDADFVSVREGDLCQHSYFLGTEFEGIPWGDIKVGAQLTPPRRFMTRDTERLIPLASDSFHPMESLAYGGLGNGWGLGCFVFSGPELERIGLDPSAMQDAYEVVSHRIGISAVRDDAAPYSIGGLRHFQAGLKIDTNCRMLHEAYHVKRRVLNAKGFFMGQPPMALLTQDWGKRKKVAYKDMEFYTDHEMSAYRPWMTIDTLKANDRFTYVPNCLVESFTDKHDHVEVVAYKTDSDQKEVFKCRRLLLASGVLGTARIVLRSFRGRNVRLPIICNRYCYLPCIHLRMVGKPVERLKTSLAQLVLFHDQDQTHADVAVASLFSYRSLLLFRLVKEAPVNFADARTILQYLQSSFIIAGIHHPEVSSTSKFVELVENHNSITHDKLHVHYSMSTEETFKMNKRECSYMSALRTLRCFPIKRVYPGSGSSIHYAGTLPFSREDVPYTLAPNGRLRGTENVYVADGSGFRYLPAKGLTFSLMANAHLVANNALVV